MKRSQERADSLLELTDDLFEVLDLREMEPEQARRCAVTTPWRPASRPHHEALCPRGTLL